MSIIIDAGYMHQQIALQQKIHLDHMWAQKHVLVKLPSVQQGHDPDFTQIAGWEVIPDPLQKLAIAIFEKFRWTNFS